MVTTVFPFLTDGEFYRACEQLQAVSEYRLLDGVVPSLSITRTVPLCDPVPYSPSSSDQEGQGVGNDDEDDIAAVTDEEEDGATIRKIGDTSGRKPHLVVVYDIVLSPSYRVPVVYLRPEQISGHPRLNVEQFRNSVVPLSQRSAVELTGVYGALSMTVGSAVLERMGRTVWRMQLMPDRRNIP